MIEVVYTVGEEAQELRTETIGDMLTLLDKLDEEEQGAPAVYKPYHIKAGQSWMASYDTTIYLKQGE